MVSSSQRGTRVHRFNAPGCGKETKSGVNDQDVPWSPWGVEKSDWISISFLSIGFEAVGLSIPGHAALVGSDLEVLGAFEDHDGVGEHFGDEWDASKIPFCRRVLIVSLVRLSFVCPVMVGVWLNFDTSIIQPWPSTNNPHLGPLEGAATGTLDFYRHNVARAIASFPFHSL
jgi:hypothetical protein